MRHLLFLLLLCILAQNSIAQKESKHWYFGNKAGIVFPYSTALPTALTNSSMNAFEGIASISDGAGNLLFYTDGVNVFDRLHQIMPNGSGLLGSSSSTQSSIIVPWPGNNKRYYIFTTPAVANDSLRYTVVDMSIPGNGSFSNPAGDVLTTHKNKVAPSQTGKTAEKVSAYPKSDGSGYYIVSLEQVNAMGSGKLLVHELIASGVTLANSITIPNMKQLDYYGYLRFSPDGSKLAMACYASSRINLFNFNTGTGVPTPFITLTDSVYLNNAYGLEFSPNGKLLYATGSGNNVLRYLNQYDVSLNTSAAILASRVLIHSYTPANTSYYGLGALQLGPDNRLYVTRGGETSLSYINNPNATGTTCGFVLNGISLSGKMSYIGLPNFLPNFASPINNCSYFLPDPNDTNCCAAGISRNLPGGPTVSSIRYSVSGGVIQGYAASCAGIPASPALSGTSSGIVTFNPACANLNFFTTSLQSTTASGNMVVNYWVKFSTGDSCNYTLDVVGCERAPQLKCDSMKAILCVCSPAGGGMNYFNIHITNQAIPTSPICNIILNKYTPNGTLVPGFWQNGIITGSPTINLTSSQINNPIPVSGTNTLPGQTLNLQAYFFSSPAFTGYFTVTIVHCNGDTCVKKWTPGVISPGEDKFLDYTLEKVKSPFAKISAYSFRITGPSATKGEPNPYKLKYITLGISDTANGPEIIGTTGAEQYYTKEREQMLRLKYSSHARHNALFELADQLALPAKDSSGIFQLFFANGHPRAIQFTCYDDNGSILSGGTLALDTSISVGVIQLGKPNSQGAGILLFNAYPNPTQNQFQVMLSLPESTEITMVVSDLQGKEVLRKSCGKIRSGLSEMSLDFSPLTNGTYLLKMVPADESQGSNAIRMILVK